MISAVGGTLGLFTGISVITFVEVLYWVAKFCGVLFENLLGKIACQKKTNLEHESTTKDETQTDAVFHIGKPTMIRSSII